MANCLLLVRIRLITGLICKHDPKCLMFAVWSSQVGERQPWTCPGSSRGPMPRGLARLIADRLTGSHNGIFGRKDYTTRFGKGLWGPRPGRRVWPNEVRLDNDSNPKRGYNYCRGRRQGSDHLVNPLGRCVDLGSLSYPRYMFWECEYSLACTYFPDQEICCLNGFYINISNECLLMH